MEREWGGEKVAMGRAWTKGGEKDARGRENRVGEALGRGGGGCEKSTDEGEGRDEEVVGMGRPQGRRKGRRMPGKGEKEWGGERKDRRMGSKILGR